MEHHLQKHLNYFNTCGSYPFTISLIPGTLAFCISYKRNFQYYCWKAYMLLVAAHSIKAGIYLGTSVHGYWTRAEFLKLMFHSIWVVAFVIILSQHHSLIWNKTEVMQLGNGTLICMKKLEKALKPGMFRNDELIKLRLLLFFCLCMVGTCIFVIPVFILFRNEAWHFGSNVYQLLKIAGVPGYISLPLGLLTEIWFLSGIWGTNSLHMHVQLQFIQSFTSVIKELIRIGGKLRWRNSLQDLQRHMVIYRQYRILTRLYNNTYGELYIPHIKSLSGILIVQGMVMSIKLAHLKNLLLNFCGIICVACCGMVVMIIVTLTSFVHKNSVKFQMHLKSRGIQGKLARCIVRSYKVEAVKSGNFYKIHRATTFTVLGMLTNVSASVLISVHFKV